MSLYIDPHEIIQHYNTKSELNVLYAFNPYVFSGLCKHLLKINGFTDIYCVITWKWFFFFCFKETFTSCRMRTTLTRVYKNKHLECSWGLCWFSYVGIEGSSPRCVTY